MKYLKKVLSIALAAALLLSAVPAMSLRANAASSAVVEVNTASGSMNLTDVGSADWIHFTSSQVDRKAKDGEAVGILSFATVGEMRMDSTMSDSAVDYSWSDGTPTERASGLRTGGVLNYKNYEFEGDITEEAGWKLTVPAYNAVQTLTFVSGVWNSNSEIYIYANGDRDTPVYSNADLTAGGTSKLLTYKVTILPGTSIEVYGKMTHKSHVCGNMSLCVAALSREDSKPAASLEIVDVTGGGAVNLTEQGSTDWIHHTYSDGWVPQLVRKQNANIIQFSLSGTHNIHSLFSDSPVLYTWSDGDPVERDRWDGWEQSIGGVISAAGDQTGEITDAGEWTVLVPADNSIQTVTVISGLCESTGEIKVYANDILLYNTSWTAIDAVHKQYTVTAQPGTEIKLVGRITNKTKTWGNMTLGCVTLSREEVKPAASLDIQDVTSGAVNLTEQGSTDWIHHTYGTGWNDPQLVRKKGANIIRLSLSGTHDIHSLFTDSPVAYDWSDGDPYESPRWDSEKNWGGVISAAGDQTGEITDAGNWTVTIPADNNSIQTMTVIFGLCESTGEVSVYANDELIKQDSYTAVDAMHKQYTVTAEPGTEIKLVGKITNKTKNWGNMTLGCVTLSRSDIPEGENYIAKLQQAVTEGESLLEEYGDDIAAFQRQQLENALENAKEALQDPNLSQQDAYLQYLLLTSAIEAARNAGSDKQYANDYASGNTCSFGWEGDKDAPITWVDGTYRLRDNGNKLITFGVDSLPAKSVKWYNAEGYLPCFVSEYEKDGLQHKIENFADEVYVDGNRYEVAYSRMTTTNTTDETRKLPRVSRDLIALNDGAAIKTIEPGETVVREYCIGADRFGGTYAYPADEDLAAQGSWDAHYQHMKNYWNDRLDGIIKIKSVPEEYSQLIDAYKAGYIYTLIIADGNELHVGENGYDRVFDHDIIGILASLIEAGDTEKFADYAQYILLNIQYPDAAWKFSWPFALYLEKTGDYDTVLDFFEDQGNVAGIKTNTHKIASERIVYDDSILDEDGNVARIMKRTWAIDSNGLWTIDNWAALFGLTTYRYLCEKLEDHAVTETEKAYYKAEYDWAEAEYEDLLKSVEAVLKHTMETYDFNYIPISMVMPNEDTARGDLREGNWAAHYLFGRWNWDGYLFGADQDSWLLEMTDTTYDYIIEQKSTALPSPYTMGGYPGYCSAYNAGYYSAALTGEKWRDGGIKAYEWMIDNAMSSPFGWWEGIYDPNENSPWEHQSCFGGGSSQHMWGQSVATKVLIDSFLAEKSDGTIIAGRGLPAEWNAPGETIEISDWLCNGGKHIGFVMTSTEEYIDFELTGDELENPVSLELIALKDNIKRVDGCTFDAEKGTVLIPAGTRSVRVYLGQAIPVEGVTLDQDSLTLDVGETAALTATVSPENADEQTVTWSSSDEKVATVDGNGVVTAVSAGTAVITVTTAEGSFTASCQVTVCRPTQERPVVNPGGSTASKPTETEPQLPFRDVKQGAWYYDAVAYVYAHDLMQGMSANTFAPDATLTRGQLVTVLYRIAGSPKTAGENPFTDVDRNQYYFDAVVWAYENHITEGVSATAFAPDAAVTREQFVTFLARYAALENKDLSKTADLNTFSDAAQVSGYAKDAMGWAVANGIVNGAGGKLDPQGLTTRAQVAAIIMRYCENL